MALMHFRMTGLRCSDQNITFQGLPFHHFILKDPVTDSKGEDKEEMGGKKFLFLSFLCRIFSYPLPFFLAPIVFSWIPKNITACSLFTCCVK